MGVRNFSNATRFNPPFNYAINSCTLNPANCLGIADRKGSIRVGKDADLVVLEKDYSVAQTYCMGKAQL